MNNRYKILFVLPVIIGVLVAVFAFLLNWQLGKFEESYLAESKEDVVIKGRLVSQIVINLLNEGKVQEAENFCNQFNEGSIRLSLIDSNGKVNADSAADIQILDNHQLRPEIKSAFEGMPATTVRYSGSVNSWLIYHAMLLNTRHGDYVLRLAITADKVGRIIYLAKINIFLALTLGALLVSLITMYIINRVRQPLLKLQNSVAQIAGGNFEVKVDIPEKGFVRDLAASVSKMAEQLKIKLREVIQERNEKESVLNAMSEAVLLFKPNGDVVRYNQAADKFFNISRDGGRFNLSRSGIAELLNLSAQTFGSRKPFEQSLDVLRNGQNVSLWIKGGLLQEVNDTYLWLAIADLTNVRKLESFRSDFIANVSHEIKTPLTCIMGAVEAMQETPHNDHSHMQKLMDLLMRQAKRLNSLLQDILSLAALEKQQLNFNRDFVRIKLDSMLINAVNLCRENAIAKEVEIRTPELLPLEVEGDCQLLEQAVINLINNALKYSESRIIDVTLTALDNYALIKVTDYGIGIPKEHLERIFERFYRVDKSRSQQLGGTGLGLAIVKHIAQLHHGQATVESNYGHGCSFCIMLPLSQ